MKSIAIKCPFPDGHSANVIEGNEINVRDKNAMRRRLLSTQMVEPENIEIEIWAPGGQSEIIAYEYSASLFGEILVATSAKGICYLGFTNNDRTSAINDFKRRFPQNSFIEKASSLQANAIMLMNDPQMELPIQLHLKGTEFQLDIWKKLTQIPLGGLTTYTQLGGTSKIARATGAAVGSNPVGFLLPCHRVVYSNGSFDGYFWGTELKEKLLAWEAKRIIL